MSILATNGFRIVVALLLLACHIIAMATAASFIDDRDESTRDYQAVAGSVNRPILVSPYYNILGFLFASAFAVFELMTLSSADKDGELSFGFATLVGISGIIELGFAAKSADSLQGVLSDTYKAEEAFGIIAGGLSFVVLCLKLYTKFTSDSTAVKSAAVPTAEQ